MVRAKSTMPCRSWLPLNRRWVVWRARGAFDPAQALVAGLPKQCFEPGEGVEVNVAAAGELERLRGSVRLVGIIEAFDGVGVNAAPLVGPELLPDNAVSNAELGRLGERFVRVDDASGDFEGGNGMSGE